MVRRQNHYRCKALRSVARRTKLRKDLLAERRGLAGEAEELQIRDGVISSTEDTAKRTTFAER